MAQLILVCGPSGAGKTTYSLSLCEEIKAIRFSIDPWMNTLFSCDMTSLDFSWINERVTRCCEQIWEVAHQILHLDGKVVLDLGFTTKAQRTIFIERAKALGVNAEVHYLKADKALRLQRIQTRNVEKDPAVYAFEVTDIMFNFMESKFEAPCNNELQHGIQIKV